MCNRPAYGPRPLTHAGLFASPGYGKGLGVAAAAQYVWISPYNNGTTPIYSASLNLVFGNGLSNTVLRGDYNSYVVYLISTKGSPVAEVCSAPTAMSPTTVLSAGALPAQYGATGVTTATFTGNTNLSAWVVGLIPPNVSLSTQIPGGFCDTTTKPKYDNMLVTFTGATILRCSNVISVAQQGGSKLANYGICQASNTPLADVSTGGICQTCMWDKYSTMFISTDGGVTGIPVAGTFFRPWTYYTMAVGSTASFTGILTYSYPTWTLTPRDQNDVSGLAVLPANAAYPVITIGSQSNGIKQQTYQWASPGPTLGSGLDPNGVTAAANLPIGMPPRVLGPLDTINNAGTTITGSGVFFCQSGTTGDATCSNTVNTYAGNGAAPGQPGWVPDWNGCPNASAFAFIYSGPTSGTQQLCGCYPPNYYSPRLGSNGAGTTYTQVSGVVTFIEGAPVGSPPAGIASFYMQSGALPNQALFVYQDAAAGKVVTLGDYVTITAIPYSYYGLVEMQNTLNVIVANHSNPIPPPIVLADLSALDVVKNGHCGASSVIYRANRVTMQQVTVSKVFMYEPFPLNYAGTTTPVQYWFNGTNVGTAYSAGFNSTIGVKMSNWYNANNCANLAGVTQIHPITGAPFICTIEVTDGLGNYAIVDQCAYSTNGGLVAAFMGTDGATRPTAIANADGTITPACTTAPCPLAVGDTFSTITGTLKYNRGGSYRELSAGGSLQMCILGPQGDGNPSKNALPYTGRNAAFVNITSSTVSGSVSLAGFTAATFTVPVQTALQYSIAQALTTSLGSTVTGQQVVITSPSAGRRKLLDLTVSYYVIVPQGVTIAQVNNAITAPTFTTTLTTATNTVFASYGLTPPTISVVTSTTTTTTNNKSVLAVGLGVGIGGGCGVIILLGLIYRFVLKKKVRVAARTPGNFAAAC